MSETARSSAVARPQSHACRKSEPAQAVYTEYRIFTGSLVAGRTDLAASPLGIMRGRVRFHFFVAGLYGDLLAERNPFLVGHVIVGRGLECLAAQLLFSIAQLLPVALGLRVLCGIHHAPL